ncbi:MAG: hypothetical protein ACFFCS_17260, partial [Candidatus Hodarchaeota archaeon]
ISGMFLLILSVTGFFFYQEGLLIFLFSIPPFFWTGWVPLIISLIFLCRTFMMAEFVILSSDEETIRIQTRRIWKNKVEYKKKNIKVVGMRHAESKFSRWTMIIVLLVIAYENYYKNGIDLFRHANIGAYLVFCFIFTISGLLFYMLIPRKFIEIGDENTTLFIPLPSLNHQHTNTRKILKILDINEKSIEKLTSGGSIDEIFKNNILNLISGTFLITISIILITCPFLYLGDFTVPLSLALGMKILIRAFQGNKKYQAVGNNPVYRTNSLNLFFMKANDAEPSEKRVLGATKIHALEMIAYFYLISQGIKYAFRFAWWSYAGFNAIYFILGMVLILLIFFRWFSPMSLLVLNFGSFSISIKHEPDRRRAEPSPANIGELFTEELRKFSRCVSIMKENKKQLVIGLVFVAFLIVPILYYSLVHSSLIF